MALTILNQPKTHSGGRNPMLLRVGTNNYVETAGIPHVIALTEPIPKTVGSTITLKVGTKIFVITFSNTPDAQLYQVRPYSNMSNIVDFINDMNNLPGIAEYYTFNGSWGTPSLLDFVQINPDDRENMLTIESWTGTFISVTNPGAATVYRPNFKIVANVYRQAEQDAVYGAELLHSLDGIPDKTDSEVTFDLRHSFDVLESEVPASATESGAVRCRNMHCYYWVELLERYGDNVLSYAQRRIGSTQAYPGAVKGGMLWKNWDADTLNDDYFAATANRFLTNLGPDIETRENMPQWLFWYQKNLTRNFELEVVAIFSDNTTATFTAAGSSDVTGMYRFGTGYTQLDIPGNVTIPAGHRVTKYTVKVKETGGSAISETITYHVDPMPAMEENYLVYENLYGGLSTLFCRGEAIYGLSVDTNESRGVDLPDYAPNDGPLRQYGTTGRDTVSISTGYLSAVQLEQMKEMLMADALWLVEGTALRRVTLDRAAFEAMYGSTPPETGVTLSLKLGNLR